MNLSQAIKKTVKTVEKKVVNAVPSGVGVIANAQGKFSGQLRASNNVALNGADLSIVEVANYERNAISGTRSLAVKNAKVGISGFRLGDTVNISNNQPYSVNDEYEYGRYGYEKGKRYLKGALSD